VISLTKALWATTHPYPRPVDELQAKVDKAAAELSVSHPALPIWSNYLCDFQAGVPLLQSSHVAIDLNPTAEILVSLVERIVARPLPESLAHESRSLLYELRNDSDAPQQAVNWCINKSQFSSSQPGLLQYFGWAALRRYLDPILLAFSNWWQDGQEERWLRSYCPTCGASPAMGQLVGIEPGRVRHLLCGRCGTRWRFRRTGCPFCEITDDHRLAVLDIEGEAGLRIDYCTSCRGYLKTYNGQGNETLLLADWASLHLDVLAQDRGLKRLAASMYDL